MDDQIKELWDKLNDNVKSYNSNADFELLKKTFDFANNAHKEQKRKSGEPFIIHPLEVAIILSENQADTTSLVVALLHDVVEDTSVKIDTIRKEFGDLVADIVEGLTRTEKKYQTIKEKKYSHEMFRKILLAAAKDIRILLIKLADRLHNMRTLRHMPKERQHEISYETLEIFAPLAEKLGIWKIKSELEDLSLKYTDDAIYQLIKQKVAAKKGERDEKANAFVEDIKSLMAQNEIKASVYGRAKHFYSIYRKMKRKGKKPSELYDLIGIRVIVNTIPECYHVLNVLQNKYNMIYEEFDDYIKYPKANGYMSLQASFKHEKEIFEVQIRTEEMDLFAENGIAAHWRYKGESKDVLFDNRIAFIRDILSMKSKDPEAEMMLEKVRFNILGNDIIVFTPDGDPFVLPEKSTPIDFAYAVHTSIGDHCSKAEVNDSIATLNSEIRSGDVVRIITQKNAKPSRQWLNFVKTSQARSKIKKVLGMEETVKRSKPIESDILDLVDFGSYDKYSKSISRTCEPKFGVPIVGLIKEKKITIHAKECPEAKPDKSTKLVDLMWKDLKQRRSNVKIVSADKLGILTDILEVFAHNHITIHSINTEPRKNRVVFDFEISSIVDEDDMKKMFKGVEGIMDIFVDYNV